MAFSHLSRCMAILLATVTLSAHVELAAASGPNYYNAARALLGRPVCGGVRQECCAGDVCGAPGLTCRVKRCRPCGGKLEPACEFPGTFPCDAGFTPVQGACFTDTDGAGRGPRNGGAPPSLVPKPPPPPRVTRTRKSTLTISISPQSKPFKLKVGSTATPKPIVVKNAPQPKAGAKRKGRGSGKSRSRPKRKASGKGKPSPKAGKKPSTKPKGSPKPKGGKK